MYADDFVTVTRDETLFSRTVRWGRRQVEAVVKAWRWRRSFNDTYRELNRLSDRELWDIGIGRGQIPYIARDEADRING